MSVLLGPVVTILRVVTVIRLPGESDAPVPERCPHWHSAKSTFLRRVSQRGHEPTFSKCKDYSEFATACSDCRRGRKIEKRLRIYLPAPRRKLEACAMAFN